MSITPKKVNTFTNAGTLEDGDVFLGERVSGTTVRITYNHSGVDHDSLLNYVANEHIDWTSTSSNFSTSGTLASGAATVTGNIVVTGTVDGRDVATDGTKLDGIEALADVTDETNVKAALDGATIADITVATGDKVLLQDVSDSDNLRTETAQNVANLKVSELSEDTSPVLAGDLDANTRIIYWTGGGTSGNYAIKGVSGFPVIQGADANYRITTENDGFQITYGSGNSFYLDDGGPTWTGLSAATVATGDKVLLQDVDASDVIKTATAVSIRDLTPTAGFQGTGAEVRATSPTLTTPTLGVASATSINFGQDALNYYDEGTFTPTFSTNSPGDLSVVYDVQTGVYTRIGRYVNIYYRLRCTPTFTTATQYLKFLGLPFTVGGIDGGGVVIFTDDAFTWATGATFLTPYGNASNTFTLIYQQESATQSLLLDTTNITTGVQFEISFQLNYTV